MRMKNWSQGKFMLAVLLLITGTLLFVGPMDAHTATQPVTVSSCKLNSGGSKLTVKAKVKQKTSAMGGKLYLLSLNAYNSETGAKSAEPLASVKAKKGTVSFQVKYQSAMLYQKFVVAYKTGGKYQIVSNARYITNPEKLASYKGKGPNTTSKKGLQVEELSDSLEIGTQHAVVNWTLNSLLNNNAVNKEAFTYKNKVYYLDADVMQRNDELVKAYNAAGVRVTVILLLPKDAASLGTAAMQYGGYSYTKFSSFKTSSKAGCNTFEAVMTYLAKRYGTKENLVSGWILGNEVNSPCIWNYGGNKKLDTYMLNYARAFRICYNAVKSVSKYSKVYISLDNNWNNDTDGSGKRYFSSKATLDQFYAKLKAYGKISFQIAFHAYPQGMSDPVFWDDTWATNSTKARIVNFKNISVLTKYAKKNFGKDCTVMLSEQSFNSSKGEALQAAAYAYAYYISESNSMIESFIYGREFDHPEEMSSSYYWGLCDIWHTKRLVWSVFQYIDSADSFKFTNPLVGYTNLKKWTKISGFKKTKITNMASKRKQAVITGVNAISPGTLEISWEKISAGDGYELYRDGRLLATIAGNSNVSYQDKGLTTGGVYTYQVRMYKEAPDSDNANKRIKLYGPFSNGAAAVSTAGTPELNEENCTVNGNEVKIAWKKMSDVSGFEIYRSTDKLGNYTLIGTVAGDKTSYTDKANISGTVYYYMVRAFVTNGGVNYYGDYSAIIERQPLIQLTASVADGKIVLNWTPWETDVTYRVYCLPNPDGAYRWLKTLQDLTYSPTGYRLEANGQIYPFEYGQTYRFRVRADFGNGTYSQYSNVAEAVITPPISNVGISEESDAEDTEAVSNDTETTDSETMDTEDTEAITPDTEAMDEVTPDAETTDEVTPDAEDTEDAKPEDTEALPQDIKDSEAGITEPDSTETAITEQIQ